MFGKGPIARQEILRRVRGFLVVLVAKGFRTIICYDRNLSDFSHSRCLSAYHARLGEYKSALVRKQAGVDWRKENLQQSVAQKP